MRNTNYRILGLLFGMLLACTAATAADGKKKIQQQDLPKTPLPSDRDLGFFGNTRDEMLASIRRVGLIAPSLPYWLDDHEDAKQAVVEAVTKYLKSAGMDVVGPQTFQAAYDRFNKQMGGLYDPKTGVLREEVSKAVYQNARREFVSKERLDGYVVLRVQKRTAHYSNFFTDWDGVRETSDGKPPPNGLVQIWGASDFSGSMTALSLTLQIANAQDRIVFGRYGGIQTINYFKNQKGEGYQFVTVASKDQLRDVARIDRAVKVATLPLIHTPREIWLGFKDPELNAEVLDLRTLPPLPPAAPRVDPTALLVPREKILASVHRVALSPLNTGAFEVPEETQKRLVELV